MTPKLARALRNGGCLAPLPHGSFGVWRGRDMRRRPVGELSSAYCARLVVLGLLAPIAKSDPQRFVWSGAEIPDALISAAIPRPQIYEDNARARAGSSHRESLLEKVLLSSREASELRRLASAAARWRHDEEMQHVSALSRSGQGQALDLGVRVDGGPGAASDRPIRLQAARAKVLEVRGAISRQDLSLLHHMIIRDGRTRPMARRLCVSDASCIVLAQKALARLADLYDQGASL